MLYHTFIDISAILQLLLKNIKNKFVNNSKTALIIPVFRDIIKQKLHKECFNEKKHSCSREIEKAA